MAIDTRSKRASVLGVGRPYMRGKNPDAAKDQAWRMATGNVYNGNALGAPPAGGTTNPFSMGAVNLLHGKLAG